MSQPAPAPPRMTAALPVTVPFVASTPLIDNAVSLSDTLAKLVAFANANPQLLAALVNLFGARLKTAAHSAIGSLLGVILGWASARLSVTPDPNLTLLLCSVGALAGNAVWNGGVMLWRKWK